MSIIRCLFIYPVVLAVGRTRKLDRRVSCNARIPMAARNDRQFRNVPDLRHFRAARAGLRHADPARDQGAVARRTRDDSRQRLI